MTRVVALLAWSNGNVTMEEKGVYDIDDALATDLIAQGLCADAATYFGGGGSGGGDVVIAHITISGMNVLCDMTYQEIKQAIDDGKTVIAVNKEGIYTYTGVFAIHNTEHNSAVAFLYYMSSSSYATYITAIVREFRTYEESDISNSLSTYQGEIPKKPNGGNGTYTLQVVRNNGQNTYSWVAQE